MNGDRGALGVLLPLGFKTYTLKAPAVAGAFSASITQKLNNQPLIPGTIERS